MTAHQRRPGFRLPWSSETDQGDAASTDAEAQSAATEPTASDAASEPDAQPAAASADVTADSPDTSTDEQPDPADADPSKNTITPTPEAPMSATTAPPSKPAEEASAATGFLGDLVAAMRRVADEARETTLADLRSRVDQAIREREEDAERRRSELRTKAETDVAAVGDWAKAEAERIKSEAEQRVASRRAQLDRQLAAETAQVDSAADALRSRIAAYERELEAYHDQLAATSDPAAFAAAAKRMPPPPALDGSVPAPEPVVPEPEPEPQPAGQAQSPGTNGSAPGAPVADAELEKLDAKPEAPTAAETYAEPVATEIVVKGLGSFGAITGFRQQLANVEGIDAVGLSLGTSGEFVFRATHRPNVDMAAAITALEGDAVEIEPRAEGGLRVTLGRPR
ncbi:MAG: hypothetical protein ABI841_08530 [Chloroflexota bacterium]